MQQKPATNGCGGWHATARRTAPSRAEAGLVARSHGTGGKVPAEGSSPRVSLRFKLSRIPEQQPHTETSFTDQLMGSILPSSKAGSQELLNLGKAGTIQYVISKRLSITEILEDTKNLHNNNWFCSDSVDAVSFCEGTFRAVTTASHSPLSLPNNVFRPEDDRLGYFNPLLPRCPTTTEPRRKGRSSEKKELSSAKGTDQKTSLWSGCVMVAVPGQRGHGQAFLLPPF